MRRGLRQRTRVDWRTPSEFFRERWNLWRFNVDAAADDANALVRPSKCCTEWCGHHGVAVGRYYTREINGLNPEHYRRGDRVWCNPPYENVITWVQTASETRLNGVFWELLLQPATDTRWFHRYVWDARLRRPREGVDIEFLQGRLRFWHPDEPGESRPPAANMLVRFFPEEEFDS